MNHTPARREESLPTPAFCGKNPWPRITRKREKLTHGVQAGGIRIIILRQLFFHWVGPVPGRFVRGDVIDPSCPWSYFLAGLSLRKIGGKVIRKL
jgi:hypothetical protein